MLADIVSIVIDEYELHVKYDIQVSVELNFTFSIV